MFLSSSNKDAKQTLARGSNLPRGEVIDQESGRLCLRMILLATLWYQTTLGAHLEDCRELIRV
jgi:hypothetical protein